MLVMTFVAEAPWWVYAIVYLFLCNYDIILLFLDRAMGGKK